MVVLVSRIFSTSYTSESFSGWSSVFIATGVSPFAGSSRDTWNMGWSLEFAGSRNL